MRTICIYHKNCFDGICAAWVVSKVYPDAMFHPYTYGDKFPWDIPTGSYVIMVDISLPREEMLNLMDRCQGNLIVLDHHKTAQKECEGLDFCKFDMNESGASLAWKHFFPETKMPKLVEYIKDRDLWRFELPNSEAVNAYIQSFPMNITQYEDLNLWFEKMPFGTVIREGEAILRYKHTMVEDMCKNVRWFSLDIDGPRILLGKVSSYDLPLVCPVVNASILFSEVGHELCKQFPEAPFAAYYFDRLRDGVRQWGLRSIGDFDVSTIAKMHGGGGHKNAAGFEQRLEDV